MNFDPRSQLRRSMIAWILGLIIVLVLLAVLQGVLA